MNTRAAGRGTTTAGIAAHDRRRDDRGSRRRAWEARDEAGRDLPTGVHLDQVRDLSGEPDHVGEPVVDRLQHGPVSSGWTVFRPATGEPVVDRLQHRSSSSRRRKPSAHERTEHHVPPGTVDLPGLWTPAHRRAESGGRRGGRPQAVGNLAGERRRPCLHTGREIPTVPQRIIIIIDNRVRTGLVPTVAAAGQCRSRGRRGRDFAIGIHLNQALELSKPPGPRQFSGDEAAGEVLALSDGQFWEPEYQRELMFLLKDRWTDFPAERQDRIGSRILNGPPGLHDKGEAKHAPRRAAERFGWLMKSGCTPSPGLRTKWMALKNSFPEWRDAWVDGAVATNEVLLRRGWGETNKDVPELEGLPIGRIAQEAQQCSGPSVDPFVDHRPFRRLVKNHPRRAIAALGVAARRRMFPGVLWQSVLLTGSLVA